MYDNAAIFLLFIQEIQASTSGASLLPMSDGFGYSSFSISKGIYQCMYQNNGHDNYIIFYIEVERRKARLKLSSTVKQWPKIYYSYKMNGWFYALNT